MRFEINEIAFVKPFLSQFVKTFVNPDIQKNSIYPSLTLFWGFVKRVISLTGKFVVRDPNVIIPGM